MSGGPERLKALLAADDAGKRRLLSVPGCWDGLSALLIERAGFEAAFVSGGAVAMARLGRPDMGLTTASEAADVIAAIADRVTLPLIADGDTGFGNALNLRRTVRMFERAGASAIQIEDQGFPKRCGHMAGKAVVPMAEALGRIHAALDTREAMLVVARTDALAVEGVNAALDRAEAFVEAGADLVFVEGPRTPDELATIATRFAARVPLVHNLVEGGVSPTDSGAELERLGFAVALHPLVLLHGLVAAAPQWLARLRGERSTSGFADELADLPRMNALTGAEEWIDWGKRYGGE
jgi:2-methylisocitrate lyase-like PEP mutase family enzyme